MYSLDINFLNDREDRETDIEYAASGPVGGTQINWAPAVAGVLIGLIPLAGVLGLWFWSQQEAARLEKEKSALQAKVDEQGRVAEVVAAAEAQAQAAEDEAKALVTVFDQIKPWSAMMANVRETIPSGVQVQSVQQGSKDIDGVSRQTVDLKGLALSFDDVNDFVLVLRRSPFLDPDNTSLVSSQLVDNPESFQFSEDAPSGIQIQQPKVVQYSISSTMTDQPASELLAELESTLAVGLTSRIQTIQALEDRGEF